MKLHLYILSKYVAAMALVMSLHFAYAQEDGAGYNRVDDKSELKPGETMEEKVKNNFFLRTEVNKTECFVGETITAVFKAYSRLNSNSQVVRRPSLTGFSVMEMVDGYNNQPSVEKINGNYFYVHLIRKVQLFPLQPGAYPLEGAEVESDIFFRRATQRDRGLSSLRNLLGRPDKKDQPGDESLQYHVTLRTPPVNVLVSPLPEIGQPDSFSGAVGHFTIRLQMRDKKLRQREPAKVKLIVQGSGNFPLITAPQVQWPSGIDASEPMVEEVVNRYEFPLSGSKIFEYSFDTKDTGRFIIPALEFSYFDPLAKAYVSVYTEPVEYVVETGRSYGILKSPGDTASGRRPLFPLQWYAFGIIALAIITWVVYQSFFRRSKKIPQIAEKLNEPTPEIIIKDRSEEELSMAVSALHNGDIKTFYNGVEQTIKEAAAFRFQFPASSLSRNTLPELLSRRHIPDAVVEKTRVLLSHCEWALYTPEPHVEDALDALDSLKALLPQLKGVKPTAE